MHIIGSALAILAAIAFWIYRAKAAKQSADEILDAAGKIRGAYNRKKFKNQVEGATISAIEDLPTAATTIICAIVELNKPLDANTENVIREDLRAIMQADDPDEILIFSKWAAQNTRSTKEVIARLGGLLDENLNQNEREEMVEMVIRAVAVSEGPTGDQIDAISNLKHKLSLE